MNTPAPQPLTQASSATGLQKVQRRCRLFWFILIAAAGLYMAPAQAQTNVLTGLQPTGVTTLNPVNSIKPMGLQIQFNPGSNTEDVGTSIKILILMTVLSLAPGIVIMMTSFTRIIIVFGFLKQAMGTQSIPPGQVLTGLSIFLTIFIMAPVWQRINTDAVQPYIKKQITQEQAWERGIAPLHAFMLKQTGRTELALFLDMSGSKAPEKPEDISMVVLTPAFMTSELKTAFQLGFLIYLPFLVIDLVVSSALMALGMMMLPPMMISLPIKILFFVLADGWVLLIRNLVQSFKV